MLFSIAEQLNKQELSRQINRFTVKLEMLQNQDGCFRKKSSLTPMVPTGKSTEGQEHKLYANG